MSSGAFLKFCTSFFEMIETAGDALHLNLVESQMPHQVENFKVAPQCLWRLYKMRDWPRPGDLADPGSIRLRQVSTPADWQAGRKEKNETERASTSTACAC